MRIWWGRGKSGWPPRKRFKHVDDLNRFAMGSTAGAAWVDAQHIESKYEGMGAGSTPRVDSLAQVRSPKANEWSRAARQEDRLCQHKRASTDRTKPPSTAALQSEPIQESGLVAVYRAAPATNRKSLLTTSPCSSVRLK
jgi:hypothetical protein